jgi:hypothetical protein
MRVRSYDGSNALVLPAKGTSGGSTAGAAPVQPQLSKSQLKKLKQVQLKKQRREELSQVCLNIGSASISIRACCCIQF